MRHPIDPKLAAAAVQTEEERWPKFFVEGERLDPAHLPAWVQNPEMQEVMSTVRDVSENERAYHACQPRQNSARQQKTIAMTVAKHVRCLALRERVGVRERSGAGRQVIISGGAACTTAPGRRSRRPRGGARLLRAKLPGLAIQFPDHARDQGRATIAMIGASRNTLKLQFKLLRGAASW